MIFSQLTIVLGWSKIEGELDLQGGYTNNIHKSSFRLNQKNVLYNIIEIGIEKYSHIFTEVL